jgi:uncharacterized repeat protein (TIGR01451 family)
MGGKSGLKTTMVVAVTALVASGLTLVGAQPVDAVNPEMIATHMEIDASPNANKTTDVAGNFDWNDILDGTLPGPYVGSGFTSAGIVDASYVIDSPGTIALTCESKDATGFPGSQTIHTNPWVIEPDPGNPTKKGDLCTGAAAAEVIDVDGDIHYILYQYWTREPTATGDVSMFQILEGPRPGRCDDRLLESNYNSSGQPNTTFSVYSWEPTSGPGNCTDPRGSGTWTRAGITGVQTVGANTDKGVAAHSDTFGESAIDLTANGIIPSDTCVTFTSSGFLSRTGNPENNNSQSIDSLAFGDPIVVNNCSPVSIGKVTEPDGFGATDTFGYELDQLDGKPTHDSTLLPSLDSDGSFASITDTIQSRQTDTWSNVIARPDYRLAETTPPTNWSLKEISCTFWDPFFVDPISGQVIPRQRTVTSTSSPLSPFAIPPSITKPAGQPNTSCLITNATSGVRVAKTGAGAAGSQFSFTRTGGPRFPLTLNGAPADFGYAQGTSVTLTETSPTGTPAWDLTSINCNRLSNSAAVTPTSINLAGKTVTVTTIAGDVVSCVFNNVQQGRIIVQKATSGGTGTFAFTGAVSGSITTTTTGGVPSGTPLSANVAPGPYAVAETAAPGWTTTSTCSDGSPVGVISVAAGETVTCTFTNVKRGSIRVVKDAVPNQPDNFSFTSLILGPFTLDDDADPTLSNSASFPNLVPGVYPVSEIALPGWALASINCVDANTQTDVRSATATIALDPGDNITCTFTNVAAPGTIVVNKTAVGGDGTFGFTLAGPGAITVPPITTAAGTGTTDVVSGLQPGQTYTISENDPGASWTQGTMSCTVLHEGSQAPQAVPTTFPVQADDAFTCSITNTKKGSIVVVKNVAGANGTVDFSGSWRNPAAFQLTTVGGTASQQTNNVLPGQYTVQELNVPADYDGVLNCVDSTTGVTSTVNGLTGTINLDPGETVTCTFTNTQRGTIIVDKVTVPGTDSSTVFDFTLTGDADGFTLTSADQPHNSGLLTPGLYTLTELAESGWVLTDLVCQSAANSQIVNGASAAITLASGDTVTCTYTNNKLGPVTVAKTVTAGPTQLSGNTYKVDYSVVVTSQSYMPETFDVSDTLGFGAGTSNIVATATPPAGVTLVAGWNGLTSTLLADNQVIPARTEAAAATLTFTISVTFDVAGSMTADARDCQSIDGEGTGTLNTTSVTSRSGVSNDSDCGVIPDPNLAIAKTVVAGPTRAADGTWTIAYYLAVTNTGEGPGHYVLSDAPHFGAGVTVTSATVAAVTAGLTTNPGFNGGGDQLVAESDIPAGAASHVYRVTVTATIAAAAVTTGAGDCVLSEGENGTGFLNVATMVSAAGTTESRACAPFSRLTLRKVVVNDSGRTAVAANFQLSASTAGALVFSGAGFAQAAVMPGTYDLAETGVAGYTTSGWVCTPVGSQGSTVAVGAGADVECVITNNDDPVADLAIVKTASNATPDIGSSFDWFLDVTNLGPSTAIDVVVTDEVPATLQVTAVSSSDFTCTFTGNSVQCVLPSMVSGATGRITITVTLSTTTAVANITNTGTVSASTPDPNLANNSDPETVLPRLLGSEAPVPAPPEVLVLPATGWDPSYLLGLASAFLIGGLGTIVGATRRRRVR